DALVEISPSLPIAIPLQRIWADERPAEVRIETGEATLIFGETGPDLLTVQRAPDRQPVPLRLTLRDAAGVTHSPSIDSIEIEERGTLRTVVRIHGGVLAGDTFLDVT